MESQPNVVISRTPISYATMASNGTTVKTQTISATKPLPSLKKPVIVKKKDDPKSDKTIGKQNANGKPYVQKVKLVCKSCENVEQKNCLLCEQNDRDTVKGNHCVDCCNYCAGCGKRGHQMYNDDGSIQCFKLSVCKNCEEPGHNEEICRRDVCSTCKTDGLGDKWVGHRSLNCYKRHKCEKCSEVGHFENRCPTTTCKNCEDPRHTTEQCELNVRCTVCDQLGHSEKRCRKCNTCGFAQIKDRPHRCRRNEKNECYECGNVGTGRCSCYSYLWRARN